MDSKGLLICLIWKNYDEQNESVHHIADLVANCRKVKITTNDCEIWN